MLDLNSPDIDHAALYERLRLARRRPLVAARRQDGPSVYALIYRGDHPLYRRIAGRWPVYLGAAHDTLETVLLEHRFRLLESRNLLDEEFMVVSIPTDRARIDAERSALIDVIRPIWNHPSLSGFDQLANTSMINAVSPWAKAHEWPKHRDWCTLDEAERIRSAVRYHLSRTAPPTSMPAVFI